MAVQTGRLTAAPALAGTATLSPAGTLCLGATAALLGLVEAGVFPLRANLLGTLLFYAGLVQIGAGFYEGKRGNSFGAVVFTAYGLLWLSLLALVALPGTGFGHAPHPSTMACYLAMWAAFSAILGNGTLHLGRALPVFFVALTLFLGLLAAGTATGSPLFMNVAAVAGIGCAIAAVGAARVQAKA